MPGDMNLPTIDQRTWAVPKGWQGPALGISLSIALIIIGGLSLHLQHKGSTSCLIKLKLEGAIGVAVTGGLGMIIGSTILIVHDRSSEVINNEQNIKDARIQARLPHTTNEKTEEKDSKNTVSVIMSSDLPSANMNGSKVEEMRESLIQLLDDESLEQFINLTKKVANSLLVDEDSLSVEDIYKCINGYYAFDG